MISFAHRLPSMLCYWRRVIRSSLGDDATSAHPADALTFRCNVCSRNTTVPIDWLSRDDPSCACGSTLRFRSLIHALSLELFGRSLAIADFPERPNVTILDLSGWEGYAHRLRRKVSYTSTYLHREPRLDITTAIPPDWRNRCDVVICSDVLEHVDPPVGRAFCGLSNLLKPGGLLLLTVPCSGADETIEHFPDLFQYRLVRRSRKLCLHNLTRDGREQWFEDLVFHGGSGSTLELRVFGKRSLTEHLDNAGFLNVRFHHEPLPEIGVIPGSDDGAPVTARRTTGSLPRD